MCFLAINYLSLYLFIYAVLRPFTVTKLFNLGVKFQKNFRSLRGDACKPKKNFKKGTKSGEKI